MFDTLDKGHQSEIRISELFRRRWRAMSVRVVGIVRVPEIRDQIMELLSRRSGSWIG
ncbi:MAG: hypothetical protein ACXU89_23655 [Xanthobacteraceae bacterium]